MIRLPFVLSLLVACCSLSLHTQQLGEAAQSSKADSEPALPVRAIDLSGGKPLIGLPLAAIIGYPGHSSSDGTTFFEIYDGSKQSPAFIAGDLYGISEDGTVKEIQRDFPEKKREIAVRSIYPGESVIATLLTALPQRNLSDEQSSSVRQYYISLSKRDGTSSKLILLDLKFEPLKVAVLESGRFLALGIDTLNHQPVLALLDTDGTFIRPIDLDARTYASSETLKTIYRRKADEPSSAGVTAMALPNSVFVPYGSKVLFFQPGSNLPVHILGEGGEENSVQLLLPDGYLPEFMLASSKNDTWVVRAQRVGVFSNFQKNGIVVNPDQQLFEVDPITGKATRALQITGAHPGEVTCAAGKKLIAPRFISADKVAGTAAVWTLAEQDR